ncbi:MAG: DALR domain-containing protein [Patescibacteria group bacterium]
MNDDLNISQALAVIFNLVKEINILIDKNQLSSMEAKKILQLIKKLDQILGLKLTEEEKKEIPKNILDLVKQRSEARKNKDWQKADEIRKEIEKLGYQIEDTNKETKIKLGF